MLFKNQEELEKYIATRVREIEDWLFYGLRKNFILI
jgi:hypothetical protein